MLPETAEVEALKVLELCPAAIVTELGKVKCALLELKSTTAPDGPAGPVSFTVTFTADPPVTELALRIIRSSPVGRTVKLVAFEVLPNVAASVTTVEALTPPLVTAKLALEAPEATKTEAGTLAAALLECRLTVVPEEPAGPVSVTVASDCVPAEIVERDRLRPPRMAAVKVVVPLTEELPTVAVIFTAVEELTPLVFCTYQ